MPGDRLKSLKQGDPIHLCKDALPHVKIRNWTFREIDHGVILLDHKEKGYILEGQRRGYQLGRVQEEKGNRLEQHPW